MSDNKDNKKTEAKPEPPQKPRTFIVSDIREAKNYADDLINRDKPKKE